MDVKSRLSPEDNLDQKIYPLGKTVIVVFLILLSCMYIPCAVHSFEYTQTPVQYLFPAYMLIGAGIAFLIIVVKNIAQALLVSLSCLLLYGLTESVILPALIVAIILALSLGAFVSSLTGKKAYPLLILIPIASYLGACLLTGNYIYSVLSVVLIPSAFVQGFMQKKNAERKAIIIASSCIFIILSACCAALLLYKHNMLSVSAISTAIDNARNSLIEWMRQLTVEVGTEVTNVFKPELIETAVVTTFNTLPGMIIATVMTVVFFSHSVQTTLYTREGLDIFVTEKNTKITVSVFAACLFVLAYLLSLSTDVSGNTDMLGVVGTNLRLILTPGLFVCGMGSMGVLMRKIKLAGCLIYILLLVAFFILSAYIVLIIAAVGAIHIIIKAIDEWAKSHYSKNNH